MKKKFTPGPWVDGKMSDAIVSASVKEAISGSNNYYGGKLIAESVSRYDKQLIKVAPELLEALEGVKSKMSEISHKFDKQYNLWSNDRQALYDIIHDCESIISKAYGSH